MRKIGSLADPDQLRTFSFYLYSQGIEVREPEDGDPDIWVLSDDHLRRARALLDEFVENPEDKRYRAAAIEGKSKRAAEVKASQEQAKRQIDARTKIFHRPRLKGGMTGTLFLIILCISYFLAQLIDRQQILRHLLSYSQDYWGARLGFREAPEIMSGQIWRLVTPIFIHFDVLHILFNMLWMYQLGVMVELEIGTRRFLWMVAVVAAISNTAFYFVAGPAFCGMSGVVYGLIGYIWAVNRYENRTVFPMDDGLFKFFLIYYVLCWALTFFGIGVANTIHGFGGLVGILFGIWATRATGRFRLDYKRQKSFITFATVIALIVGAMITDFLAAGGLRHL